MAKGDLKKIKDKTGSTWNEFKNFAFRGNVVDLAVGVLIGGAMGTVVNSIVNDLLMPIIGLVIGDTDMSNLFVTLNGTSFDTLAAARDAGAPVFAYGSFITAIINFLLIALCVFLVVKFIARIKRLGERHKTEEAAVEPRFCPYCRQEIAADATKCPHCCSSL